MLADIIEYSGLYTKIKALESRLLTYNDYYELASQKSVREFGERLLEIAAFKKNNSDIPDSISGGRIALEKSLGQMVYLNFTGIFSFLTNKMTKKYLEAVFSKYEVDIIKILLRSIFDERSTSIPVHRYNNFFMKHLGVNFEKLASSTNISEFIYNLGNSDLQKVLKKLNVESSSLFDFETQLDFYRYIKVWEAQSKYLKGINLRSQEKINGTDIDLHNIMHIYRFKKYYDLNGSIIFTYLMPINYMIKKSELDSLIHANTEDDFREILNKSHYKGIFDRFKFDEMEKSYNIHMLELHEGEAKKYPYSIAPVMAYFFRKEQEVRNLITLTECVRYGLVTDISMSKILRPKKEINLEKSQVTYYG